MSFNMGLNNAHPPMGSEPGHLVLLQGRLDGWPGPLDAMGVRCNTQELRALALPTRLVWRSIWACAKDQANVATKREDMQIGFACAGVQVLNTSSLLVFFFGGWGGVGLHDPGHYSVPNSERQKPDI